MDLDPAEARRLTAALLRGERVLLGPRLTVMAGPAAGTRLPVGAGAILGRGGSASLSLDEPALDEPALSRRHALFGASLRGMTVARLRAKNGLRVNGRRVGRRPVALRAGDELTAGRLLLRFDDEQVSPGALGPPVPRPPRRPARLRDALAVLLALGALTLLLLS